MNIGAVESTLTLNDNFTKGIVAAAEAARNAQRDFAALAGALPGLSRSTSTFAAAAGKASEAITTLAAAQAKALEQIQAAAAGTTTLTGALKNLSAANVEAAESSNTHAAGGYNVATMLERLALRVTVLAAAYKTLSTIRDSVTEALDVSRGLTQIEVITNAGAKGVDELRGAFARLADSTGQGPKALSDAYYLIASASQTASNNMAILEESAKASAVGLGSTADIAKVLTGAINAYGAANLPAAKAADMLFEAVKQGGVKADEFAGALGRITALAAQAGVSFGESLTYISSFTRMGVSADEAVTALRGTLNALLTDSPRQRQALVAINMSMAGLRQEIREKGLTQAMLDLVKASKGNEEIIHDIIPNVRALAGVMSNYASQADNVVNIQKAITDSTGALDKGLTDAAKSGAFAADVIAAHWELFKLKIGETVLPEVLKLGSSLLETFNDPKVVEAITGLVSAAKPLVDVVTLAVTHIGELRNALTLFIAVKFALWLTDAAGAAKVLNAAITLLEANPLVATFVAIGYAALELHDHLHNLSVDGQKDIEALVEGANSAGVAFQNLLQLKNQAMGTFVTQSAFSKMRSDADEAATSVHKLQMEVFSLEDQRKHLDNLSVEEKAKLFLSAKSLQTEKDKLDELILAKKDDVNVTQSQLHAQIAQIELIKQHGGVIEDVVAATKRQSDNTDLLSQKEKSYAERVEETKAAFAARVKEAQASLAVEQQVHAAVLGGNNAEAEAIARAAERQTKINQLVTELVNKFKDANHEVGPDSPLYKWAVQQATALVDANRQEDKLKQSDKDIAAAKQKQLELQQKQAEEYRKQQEAIGKITAKIQDQIDEQNHQLDVTKQAVAEALSGGSANALDVVKLADKYYKEIGDHTERGAANAHRLAVETAATAAETEKWEAILKLVTDALQPMWKTWLQAGMDAIGAITSTLSKGISDALKTGTVDATAIWKDFVGQLIDIFANFLADLVKRWLEKELAETAITLTQAAIRNAADNGGSSATGANGGQGAYMGWGMRAYSQYQQGGGWSGLSANTAGTGSGSGYSAAGGSGYTLGVAAVWVAAIFTFLNYISTHIEKMGSGAVGLNQPDSRALPGTFTFDPGAMGGGTSAHNQYQVQQAGQAIADKLNSFVDSVAAYAVSASNIGLKKKGQGGSSDWIVYVNGVAEHFGKDMQAAEDYAYVQLIKSAKLEGLPSDVIAAIKSSAATTADQINQEIANAYTVFFEKMGEVGAQVYQIYQKYQTQIDAEIDKFLSTPFASSLLNPAVGSGTGGGDGFGHFPGFTPGNRGGGTDPYSRVGDGSNPNKGGISDQEAASVAKDVEAVTQLIAARNREVQAIRDSLLGLDTSGAKRLQDIMSYNQGIEQSRLMAQAEVDKINAEIAQLGNDPNATAAVQHLKEVLQKYIDELNSAPDQIKGAQLDMAVFDELFKFLPKTAENEKLAAHYAQMKAQLELAALEGQIKVLQAQGLIGNEFDALLKQAEAFVNDPNNFKPGRTGGGHTGGSQLTQKDAQKFLADQAYALAEASKTALQQRIDDIHKQYAEEEKAAGKNAKLRQDLIAQEAAAVAAAKAQAQQQADADFNSLVGPNDAFAQLHDKFAKVRQELIDAQYPADVLAKKLKELGDAEKQQADLLAQQLTGDLLGGLAGMLADGIEKQKLLNDQAKINWIIQLANLKAQRDLLVAQGYLAGNMLAEVDKAIADIQKAGPPTNYGNTDPNHPPPGASYWDGHQWVTTGSGSGSTDPRQAALDLLHKYENDNLDKWHQALAQFNADWNTIFTTLGRTPETIATFNEAFQKLRDQFLSGLRDFRDQLQSGSISGNTISQQYADAAAKYRQLLTAVQGGDLSQADALRDAASTYRDLAAQMFGTATGGFAAVRDEILRDLSQILDPNSTANNVIGGPSYFAQAAQLQINAISSGSANTVTALKDQTDALSAQTAMLGQKLDATIAALSSIDKHVVLLEPPPPSVSVG